MQHTDSTAAVQVAEKAGVWSFGQASDMQKFAPKSVLTSIIDDWAPYYVERSKAAKDGTWKQQDTWHGLKEGMVAMGPYNPAMGSALVKEVEQLQKDLASGKVHSFTGPIYDQEGNIEMAEKDYLEAIDLNPNLFGANYNLGALYFNYGVKLKDEASNTSSDAKYRALTKQANDNFTKALPYMEDAFNLNREDRNTIISLKQLYALKGDYDKSNEMKKKLDNLPKSSSSTIDSKK